MIVPSHLFMYCLLVFHTYSIQRFVLGQLLMPALLKHFSFYLITFFLLFSSLLSLHSIFPFSSPFSLIPVSCLFCIHFSLLIPFSSFPKVPFLLAFHTVSPFSLSYILLPFSSLPFFFVVYFSVWLATFPEFFAQFITLTTVCGRENHGGIPSLVLSFSFFPSSIFSFNFLPFCRLLLIFCCFLFTVFSSSHFFLHSIFFFVLFC